MSLQNSRTSSRRSIAIISRQSLKVDSIENQLKQIDAFTPARFARQIYFEGMQASSLSRVSCAAEGTPQLLLYGNTPNVDILCSNQQGNTLRTHSG